MSNGMDKAFELYKLEYEKGAERYENIYKAVWANFSYLTVVSGGIYAFGSRLFSWETTAVLAIVPLVFWWLAIFEPMNRYGDEVAKRLWEVEQILNALYAGEIITPLQTTHIPADLTDASRYGLKHYTHFAEQRASVTWRDWLPWRVIPRMLHSFIYRPRTRYWVRAAVVSLSVVVLFFAKGIIPPTFFSTADTVIIDRPFKPLDGRIVGVDMQDLKDASEKDPKIKKDVDALKEALKTVSDDVRALKPK
jgi:hypothetical protein